MQSAMNALNPVLTIGAQLDRRAAGAPAARWTGRRRRDRAAELLDMVGITADRLRSYPHELSGGMRQRVMIAMALALEPQVVIMDEPTTALDVVTQREILEELAALRERLGLRGPVHHPRPVAADRDRRLDRGDVRGPAGGAGRGRGPVPRAAAPLHAGPAAAPSRRCTARASALTGIPGSPPDLRILPPGCAFHPRCRLRDGRLPDRACPPLSGPARAAGRARRPAGCSDGAARCPAELASRAGARDPRPGPGPAAGTSAARYAPDQDRRRAAGASRAAGPGSRSRPRGDRVTAGRGRAARARRGPAMTTSAGHGSARRRGRRRRCRGGPPRRAARGPGDTSTTRGRPRGGARGGGRLALAARGPGSPRWSGESGSGKSTLARLLARLITPTAGELLLDGSPVPAAAAARGGEYARQVQMVLQDPFASLNPVHDVRYHLARPLQMHGLGTAAPSLDEAIAEPARAGRAHPARAVPGKYPHELSGGQRQRVAIARALAVRPRVLLADEPVSMLDVSIRLGILNLLGDLRERERLAILYITHDIASARYLADAIVVMYAGQVVESGPGHHGDRPARAPLHPAAARARRPTRTGPSRPSLSGPRRAAQPGHAAARLPVPPALPARDGHLRATRAARLEVAHRARQRLLAARTGRARPGMAAPPETGETDGPADPG